MGQIQAYDLPEEIVTAIHQSNGSLTHFIATPSSMILSLEFCTEIH